MLQLRSVGDDFQTEDVQINESSAVFTDICEKAFHLPAFLYWRQNVIVGGSIVQMA
jgi:hypothetical protein